MSNVSADAYKCETAKVRNGQCVKCKIKWENILTLDIRHRVGIIGNVVLAMLLDAV